MELEEVEDDEKVNFYSSLNENSSSDEKVEWCIKIEDEEPEDEFAIQQDKIENFIQSIKDQDATNYSSDGDEEESSAVSSLGSKYNHFQDKNGDNKQLGHSQSFSLFAGIGPN